MKQILLGGIAAGVAVFIWGAIYWMFGPADNVIQAPKNEIVLSTAIKASIPEPGTYFIPGGDPGDEAFLEKHREGPVAMLHVRDGHEAMAPSVFGKGIAHNIVTGILIAALLAWVAPALSGYGSRVGFITAVGVVSTIATHGAMPIWWPIDMAYTLMQAAYSISLWLVSGLVLGAIVKPKAA